MECIQGDVKNTKEYVQYVVPMIVPIFVDETFVMQKLENIGVAKLLTVTETNHFGSNHKSKVITRLQSISSDSMVGSFY